MSLPIKERRFVFSFSCPVCEGHAFEVLEAERLLFSCLNCDEVIHLHLEEGRTCEEDPGERRIGRWH